MPIAVITEKLNVQNAVPDDQYTGLEDTVIDEGNPTAQGGTQPFLGIVNSSPSGDDIKTILRATGLSNIPSNATVSSASLYMRSVFTDAGTVDVDLRRCLRPWVANETSWNNYATGTPWGIAGASGVGSDYDPTIISTTTVNSNGSTWFSFDCTTLVQDIIDGTIVTDNGFLLTTDDEAGTIRTYTAADNTDSDNRPELIVNYTIPAAQNVTDIDTDENVTDGQTGATFTTNGFTGEITQVKFVSSGTETLGNGVVSSSGAGTFNMPDVSGYTVDTTGSPFGSGSWTLTDGTDSASLAGTLSPKTGWDYVVVSGAVKTTGSVFENFIGTILDSSQVYYPTASSTSVDATGILNTSTSNDIDMQFWDISDNTWKSFTVVTAANATPANVDMRTWSVQPETPNRDGNFVSSSRGGPYARNRNSAVGINIDYLYDFNPTTPFINFMKRGRTTTESRWFAQVGGSVVSDSGATYDADGYPTTMPDSGVAFTNFRSVVTIDNTNQPVGDYVVLYDGEGTLSYNGVTYDAGNSVDNRHIVNAATDSTSFSIDIYDTDPNNTGNYIRNIRIVEKDKGIINGDPLTYSSNTSDPTFESFETICDTQVWHPAYLNDLKEYRAVRFLNPNQVNNLNTTTVPWLDRSVPSDFSYATPTGLPIETACKLCNLLSADMWYNFPIRSDDTYISNTSSLIRSLLDSNLYFYPELGNEIWNFATPFGLGQNYCSEQADIEWPGGESTETEYTKALNWYGFRSSQMSQLCKAQWTGDSDRIRPIIGGQASDTSRTQFILDCGMWQTYGGRVDSDIAEYFYGFAVAPYFTTFITNSANVPTLDSWLADSDSGLNKLFNEINGTPILPDQPTDSNNALQEIGVWMSSQNATISSYGLKMLAYEGGQHMSFYGNTDSNRPAINENLIFPAQRDPRMKQAYIDYLNTWQSQSGAELFCLYKDASPWDEFGAFGLREYQGDSNAKVDGTLTFIDSNDCWWNDFNRIVIDRN